MRKFIHTVFKGRDRNKKKRVFLKHNGKMIPKEGSGNLSPQQTTTAKVMSTTEATDVHPKEASVPSCFADRLPNELFSYIFLLALPLDPILYENNILSSSWSFPSIEFYAKQVNRTRRDLSQVCRRFRAIVCGTPSLWTPVCLGRSLKYDQERLKEQLERSGHCPLDIFVRPKVWPGSKARITTLNRVLQTSRHHIRRFLVQTISCEEIQALFSNNTPGIVVVLPILETLVLSEYTPKYSGPEAHEFEFFGRIYAPMLERLELSEAIMVSQFLTAPTLPITTLSLSSPNFYVSAKIVYQFLASCPHLVYLAFQKASAQPNEQEDEVDVPEYPLTLHKLKSLEFVADRTPDYMAIIECIRVPSLENLKFGSFGSIRGNILQHFSHILLSQVDTLERLTFQQDALNFDESILETVLPQMRKLKSLSCESTSLQTRVLKSLIPEDNIDEWPCPNLTLVSLMHIPAIDGEVLETLIRKRARSKDEWEARRKRKRQHRNEGLKKEREDIKNDEPFAQIGADFKSEEFVQKNETLAAPEDISSSMAMMSLKVGSIASSPTSDGLPITITSQASTDAKILPTSLETSPPPASEASPDVPTFPLSDKSSIRSFNSRISSSPSALSENVGDNRKFTSFTLNRCFIGNISQDAIIELEDAYSPALRIYT